MPRMLIWTLLWPTLVSIVLATAAWMVTRRGARPVLIGRTPTAVTVGAAVVIMTVYPVLRAAPLWIDAPSRMWSAIFDAHFALPLILGLLILVLLGAARPRPSTPAGALLAPRTWRSFLSTWWLGAFTAVLALIIGLTLAAGTASRPNDAGEYVQYVVDFGSGSIGTSIYGWHLSVVPLVLLVPLCAVTWWSLSRIARPPLAAKQTADVADRQLRSANTLRVALGALLLHLGAILNSLAETSRLSGFFSTFDSESFSAGTPFSALTGTLDLQALLAGFVGLALWVFTALTAVPAPSPFRSSRTPVTS